MQDLALFRIGKERASWLAARVAAVAANVSNADTPGYRARDIPSFEQALGGMRMEMSRTRDLHFAPNQIAGERYGMVLREGKADKHSGNTVSLDAEMAILGEARGQQALVTGILSSFHRLLLASVRS